MVVLEHDEEFDPALGCQDDIGHVSVQFVIEDEVVVGLQLEELDEVGDLIFDQGRGEHVEGLVVGDRLLDFHLITLIRDRLIIS